MGFILTRNERHIDSEGRPQRKKFIHGFLATGGALCHEVNMEMGSTWRSIKDHQVAKREREHIDHPLWFMGRIRESYTGVGVASLGSITVADPLK